MGNIFSFLVYLIFFLTPVSLPIQAAEGGKDAAREMLERRQKTQLTRFFMTEGKGEPLPQTSMAIELYNDAVELYQRRDYEMAKLILNDAMELDEHNPFAFELMGDLYNLEHDLSHAKDYFMRAYRIAPSESLREKIEKVDREAALESQFAMHTTERFIIKYRADEQSIPLEQIVAVLESVYRQISEEFGHSLKNPVLVLLYKPEEFRELLKVPHWIGGLYDGKIRLPAYGLDPALGSLESIAAHEMTHAFISDLSGGKAPAWINEGLAIHEEVKHTRKDWIVFDSAVATRALLPFDLLMIENISQNRSDPLYANLFYEQSYHVTQYLMDQKGLFEIKKLLTAFREGKNSEESLSEVFGMSIQQLENQWTAAVLNK